MTFQIIDGETFVNGIPMEVDTIPQEQIEESLATLTIQINNKKNTITIQKIVKLLKILKRLNKNSMNFKESKWNKVKANSINQIIYSFIDMYLFVNDVFYQKYYF